MSSKILWTICAVLGLVLLVVIFQGTGIPKKPTKLVSGAKFEMPSVNEKIIRPPQKNSDTKDPKVNAKAAILLDNDTFRLMYEKDPNLKVPIASTTKMMTALVVLEDYPDKMDKVVTITSNMVNVEGSDIQLRIGEKITVENLLKGMLIYSGNDAAYSLANFLAGKDNFVNQMNQKADILGLQNSHFKDPAGLDDEGYSNAKDLAILASYNLKNKTFAEIVKTPEITFTSTDGRVTHELKNSNRMMRGEEQFYYPFAIGIKTGFTPAAGHCLVSAAEKDGHTLIAVILNTNEDSLTASAQESRKLLDWGFTNWTW